MSVKNILQKKIIKLKKEKGIKENSVKGLSPEYSRDLKVNQISIIGVFIALVLEYDNLKKINNS